ncbi:MAG TPA: hypothetical protein VED59_09635, partial [Acidimicrobiales bacterium]|nr:hypothetical protein [Acidimicrobiales bacterium]
APELEAAPPAPAPTEAAPVPTEIELPDVGEAAPELAPVHAFVPKADTTGHEPEPAAVAPADAVLREALSKASREMIERVIWEVVPQLAETIIRENLDRLVKGREK